LALGPVKLRRGAEALNNVEVLRPQRLFADRKRSLAKGAGFRVAALVRIEVRQIIEAPVYVGVLRAQHFSRIASARFIKRLSFRVAALVVVQLREAALAFHAEVVERVKSKESKEFQYA
jgi:hypothetical protein